ncbi:MAG: hypothetical protein D6778_01415 [Nitrospirae bacterium]|nr:MAG: hypothetical protein D6778_01415 [Nitrospirota bacterium]
MLQDQVDRVLKQEMEEMQELSEFILKRIDQRIEKLQEIEKRIDRKVELLQRLLTRVDEVTDEPMPKEHYRIREVLVLAEKGLKVEEIASILDIPVGEVELIINVHI